VKERKSFIPDTAKFANFVLPQGEDYKSITSRRRSSLSPGQTICFGDVPHSLLASDAAHILPENKFTMRFRIIPVSQVLQRDLHCNENPIYVFPEKELRDLSPNFHIHVSVGDLYIPRIGPHIFLKQNRQSNRGNI